MQAKLTAALVAVFLCLNFASADTRIKFGGLSTHLSEKDYNSFHRTLMVSHNDYFVGYFRNSFDDDTFALGKTFKAFDKGLELNLHVGVTYGYRKSGACYKDQESLSNDPRIFCPAIAPEFIISDLPYKPSLMIKGFKAYALHFNIDSEHLWR